MKLEERVAESSQAASSAACPGGAFHGWQTSPGLSTGAPCLRLWRYHGHGSQQCGGAAAAPRRVCPSATPSPGQSVEYSHTTLVRCPAEIRLMSRTPSAAMCASKLGRVSRQFQISTLASSGFAGLPHQQSTIRPKLAKQADLLMTSSRAVPGVALTGCEGATSTAMASQGLVPGPCLAQRLTSNSVTVSEIGVVAAQAQVILWGNHVQPGGVCSARVGHYI